MTVQAAVRSVLNDLGYGVPVRPWVAEIVQDELSNLHLPGEHNQKDHGRGAGAAIGGVRDILADATTTDEVSAVLAAEATRITGREFRVDLKGSDVQIAREHAEGILRGVERFPDTPLSKVRTYGPGGYWQFGFSGTELLDAYAVASREEIFFNTRWSGDPDAYRAGLARELEQNWGATGTPLSVALHEFGHVVAQHAKAEQLAYRAAKSAAAADGVTVKGLVKAEVSVYGTTNMKELAAEAFADVMVNGDEASALSRRLFSIIEDSYGGRAK